MKKPSKSSITRKLDKEVSRITRAKGACVRCGNGNFSKLQCAHIYSRANRAVRWDLMNVLCLCAGCHFGAHKDPVGFAEFVRGYLGDLNFGTLKQRAKSIKKWTLEEMIGYLKVLEEIR